MSTLKIFSYLPNPRVWKAQIAAAYCGVDVEVVGDRAWRRVLFWVRPSRPQPFTRLPITYDRAYGGRDTSPKNPETAFSGTVAVSRYSMTRSFRPA